MNNLVVRVTNGKAISLEEIAELLDNNPEYDWVTVINDTDKEEADK